MATHLSTEQIESYLERNLTRAELGQVSEHLFSCESCYQRFLEMFEERRLPIEIDLDELAGLKDWHIQGEDLKAYVEGRMDQLDLDVANLHLEECGWCREEVDSYSEFSSKLPYYLSKRHAPARQPAGWNRYYPYLRTAALVLLMLGSAVILWSVLGIKPSGQEAGLIQPSQGKDSLQTQLSEGSPARPAPNAKAEGVFESKDETATSTPSRPDPIPSPNKSEAITDRQQTDTALISKNLVMPPVIEMFDRTPVVLRGNGKHKESFNIIGPYATMISDDRPTFRWTALDGAGSYTVSVYDADLNLVKTSEPLTATHWLIPNRLRRGVVYTWIVTAIKDGKEVVAPALPARAEFKIIEGPELTKLNRRIRHTSSNVARGVLYAEAGLLDKAEQQLQVRLRLEPGDNRARELLRVIRSWRER